jgi:hypothetical protein
MKIKDISANILSLITKGINYKIVKAYKDTFNSEAGKIVFRDLAIRFRLADVCENQIDEGGRRVMLFISTMLGLDPRDFSQIYKGEE